MRFDWRKACGRAGFGNGCDRGRVGRRWELEEEDEEMFQMRGQELVPTTQVRSAGTLQNT
ncbi:unnamed protein product [Rhodiola kirilowii]